jgi:hypothetical protein
MWVFLPIFVILWPLTLLELVRIGFEDMLDKITDFFKF